MLDVYIKKEWNKTIWNYYLTLNNLSCIQLCIFEQFSTGKQAFFINLNCIVNFRSDSWLHFEQAITHRYPLFHWSMMILLGYFFPLCCSRKYEFHTPLAQGFFGFNLLIIPLEIPVLVHSHSFLLLETRGRPRGGGGGPGPCSPGKFLILGPLKCDFQRFQGQFEVV